MAACPMRPSVLVVEDDLATRNLLRVVLNRYEFDVDALGSSVDVMMLLSSVDDATAGLLCTLSKTVHTTFSLAPIPADMPGTGSLMREPKEEIIGKMKKGPFLDGYYWTNVAHVNDAADVVKRFKIKTGEIAPDADKKADAKAKKAAATKDREKEKEAPT